MSLQVWLPLNGTAMNKGLGVVSKESGTTNFDKAGKIGEKALNLKRRSTYICPQLANLKTFSIAFWAMVEASSSITGNWMDLMGFEDISSSGSSGIFRWETCYTYVADAGIHWHDNATHALSDYSYSHNAAKGEWVHCCVVFDAVVAKIYSYSNGVLGHTATHLGGHFNSAGRFYLGENNKIEGRIQDVRIYDHALSIKEVKEISKGLCLHYKLSDYGMSNLCSNSYNFNNWAYLGAIDNTNTYNGAASIRTSHSQQGPYINLKSYVDAGAIKKGDILTYSIYVKADADIDQAHFSCYRFSANVTNPSRSIIALKKNVWQKMSYTFQVNDYSLTSTNARLEYDYPYDLVNNTQYVIKGGAHVYFALPKLELSDKATPWAPSVNDTIYKTLGFNNNVEIDCSGFGNNGSKIGTISTNSDTRRYPTCYKFETGRDYIKSTFTQSMDECSVSYWVYPSSSAGGYTNVASNYGDNIVGCWFGSNTENCGCWFYNGKYCATNDTITTDAWHHCVFVFKNKVGKWYIDGKAATMSSTLNNLTSTTINFDNFCIGNSYTGSSQSGALNKGKISDFRIYATALSADDVAELYSASAAIDNTGNGYAYELVEED